MAENGKIKVLFAAFEAVPYAKTGGLGDVAGSLPKELNRLGADVRLIMPRHGVIPDPERSKMEHVADFYVDLNWRHQYCGLDRITGPDSTVYFIDNEFYFKRDAVYGYGDDCERAAFFALAAVECIKYMDFEPDIIHCNDWHCAVIPAMLRLKKMDMRTVFTVHNLKFQGTCDGSFAGDILGISWENAKSLGFDEFGHVNLMKSALRLSDRLTTVSPTYAKEICTEYFGEGADGIFNERRSVLSGILNGIDTKVLNPATDKNLPAHYSVRTWQKGKPSVKEALQKRLGLEVSAGKPLFSIISRLTDQKGLDLVLAIIDEFMQEDVQFAVLGVGERRYEDKFKELAAAMPEKFAAAIYFDEPLSRMIYAGSDFMLVPSLFEPCGLTQITAMRYGTIPIVRETGGLKDSVRPYDGKKGVGFTFPNYNAHELLFKMKDAEYIYYNDKEALCGLIERAMKKDFSWKTSAKKYLALYSELV